MGDGPPDAAGDSFGLPVPLGMPALARVSASLYRDRFATLGPYFLVGFVFIFGISTLGNFVGGSLDSDQARLLTALLADIIATSLIGSLLVSTTAVNVVARVCGEEEGVPASWRAMPNRKDVVVAALYVAGATLFLVLLVFGGDLLVGPAMILVLLGPPVVSHAVVVERAALPQAWAKANALLQGHRLRVFLYLICIALGLVLVRIAGRAAFVAASAFLADGPREVAFRATDLILQAVTIPYLAIAMTVVYLDLRARKDKLTLAELRQELSVRSAPGAATRD